MIPVLTIIIPCRNASATLTACLQSIVDQTWTQWEVLVMDGLSNDHSVSVVNAFQHPSIQWNSSSDTGVYDAINKGLDLARGEWIYILGADDRFSSKDVLSSIFTEQRTHQGWILGGVRNEGVNHRMVPTSHTNLFSSALIWKNTIHQQGVFYHQSLFKHFKFDSTYRVLGDYDFHLAMWNQQIETHYTDHTIAICAAGGLSKQFNWSLYREELRIKRKRLPILIWIINIPWVVLKFLLKKLWS